MKFMRRPTGRRVSTLALALLVARAGAFESVDDPRRWAITGLTIVDVETGELTPGRTVVIEDGTIEAVGSESDVLEGSAVVVSDYEGFYAIPGLWDMHVHLRGGPDLIEANERWLRQYLGYGVTTARDAGGDLPSSVLHWKAEIAQGFTLGPRLYTALRKLDGSGARQRGSIPVETREDVDAALANLEFAGADFVKLYDFSFPSELYPVAVRKAEALGLKTAAHVPPSVPIVDLVAAGLDSIEHTFFLVKAANPDDRELSRRMASERSADYVEYFSQFAEIAEGARVSHARRVFRSMAAQGTAVTSTLGIDRAIREFLAGERMERTRLEQTPRPIRRTLEQSQDYLAGVAEELLPIQETVVRESFPLLGVAAEEGVMILAGSDTGANNPFVYPGDSLHTELELMVDVGMSPLQALRSATIDPARWTGLQATFGSVAAGKAADIVILESNPLDDISGSRSVAAVVQQGVYFDGEELASLRRLRGD